MEDKCPNCGSDDIEFGTLQTEGKYVYYLYQCKDCGDNGRQYYKLVFDEFVSDVIR